MQVVSQRLRRDGGGRKGDWRLPRTDSLWHEDLAPGPNPSRSTSRLRLGLIIFFHCSISATACAMYLEGSPVSFKLIGYSPNLSDFNIRSHSRLPCNIRYPKSWGARLALIVPMIINNTLTMAQLYLRDLTMSPTVCSSRSSI